MHFRFPGTISDLPATLTSEHIQTSPIVLLYPRKCADSLWYLPLLSRIQAEIYVISRVFPVMEAIFYSLSTATLESTHTGPTVLLDFENEDAILLSLLSFYLAQ